MGVLIIVVVFVVVDEFEWLTVALIMLLSWLCALCWCHCDGCKFWSFIVVVAIVGEELKVLLLCLNVADIVVFVVVRVSVSRWWLCFCCVVGELELLLLFLLCLYCWSRGNSCWIMGIVGCCNVLCCCGGCCLHPSGSFSVLLSGVW